MMARAGYAWMAKTKIGQNLKLKEQLQRRIKAQGKSPKTFSTYWYYCEDFLRFLHKQTGNWVHPSKAGRPEVEQWLSAMANDHAAAKNSQNTALQAVLYMYREILDKPLENVNALRAKRAKHTREVMSVQDVAGLFQQLDGIALLAAQLMYGAGLRISDVVSLRLKDISFDRSQLSIKAGKGDKWRFTSFPSVMHDAVRRQIESVKVVWRHDQNDNPNGVSLPDSFRKKSPRAANELRWYWLFPSDCLSRGHEDVLCRHHRHADHISRQIKEASDRAGIITRVTSHVLRHSYATHAHEQGVPMRTLMQLLGHEDIRTTEIYVHADQHAATSAHSPLETLLANPNYNSRSNRLVQLMLRR
jgi:integron integrase